MAHATPYCYKALSAEDYNTLAAYIVTSNLDASFFPKRFTIVVTPKEDEEVAFKEVGKFIDNEGLSFHINPIILDDINENNLINDEVTPSYMITEILVRKLTEHLDEEKSLKAQLTACEDNLSKAIIDKGLYEKWWKDEASKRVRIEDMLKALRLILKVAGD